MKRWDVGVLAVIAVASIAYACNEMRERGLARSSSPVVTAELEGSPCQTEFHQACEWINDMMDCTYKAGAIELIDCSDGHLSPGECVTGMDHAQTQLCTDDGMGNCDLAAARTDCF